MAVVNINLIALVVYAVFMAIYLWVTTYESSAARDSVMRMIGGNIAPVFWLGVILVGIILPVAILATLSFTLGTSVVAIIVAAVCVILGGVTLRYVILKAGMYSPLVPAE